LLPAPGRGWCWLLIVFLLSVSFAQAENDGLLRQSGFDAQPVGAAQLGRQLRSIRAQEAQSRCAKKSRAELSSRCRELARRRTLVEARIVAAGGGAKLAGLPRSKSGGRGNLMLFCVRLSDGYLFPAPNAQFVGYGAYDNTLDRCRYICRDQAMEVYVLDDVSLETGALRRLRGGGLYSELPVAYAYREAARFRACDFQRYVRRSGELQLAHDPAERAVPLPTARPETLGAERQRIALSERPRQVRVIGLPFLPDTP